MISDHCRVRDEPVGGSGFPSVQDSFRQLRTVVNPHVSEHPKVRCVEHGKQEYRVDVLLDE